MSIEKFGKVRKLAKIGELAAVRKMGTGEIAVKKRVPGKVEDPLEKAALQGVVGTLPERIVWKWLEDEERVYETQLAELGGRFWVGGAVVDFVVYDLGARPVALRVQGDYWHGPAQGGRQARDDEQAGRLQAMGYVVVDLWEGELYEAAEHERVGRYIEGEIYGAM
ncbi:MAG: hypothetical protein GWO24_30405 [Akkermansiaceae bacterium]|nr:hypothetical protein [Akkermansiaceae bacterium]